MQRWTERTFRFEFPVEHLPVIVDRLRGAIPRIEAHIRGVADDVLSARGGGDGDGGSTWSVKEHIGHLADLEVLHDARLDELEGGVERLRAADMTNRATWNADHNTRTARELVDAFTRVRNAFARRVEAMSPEVAGKHAMHPRLEMPMRAIDVAFFTAEHDDHHLAKIHERLTR